MISQSDPIPRKITIGKKYQGQKLGQKLNKIEEQRFFLFAMFWQLEERTWIKWSRIAQSNKKNHLTSNKQNPMTSGSKITIDDQNL